MTALGGDSDRARIAATALLTLPGTPFIYYGEEIELSGDKPEERLRTPMQWTGDETGGFTTGSPWEALQPDTPAVNVAAQDADPSSLLSRYRQVIHLRDTHPALAQGDLSLVDAGNPSITAYLRQTDDETALVVLTSARRRRTPRP